MYKDTILNYNKSFKINLRLTKEWKKEKSKNTTEVDKRKMENGDLIAWLQKDQKDIHARKNVNTWGVRPRNLGTSMASSSLAASRMQKHMGKSKVTCYRNN